VEIKVSGTGVGYFVESNRALWDEWAEINAKSSWYGLDAVRRGSYKLRPYEIDEVGDVEGRTLLHLQCQIGTDTIGWARRGARATGVDFSPRAVAIATALATELGVDARFVCSDVLELPQALDGTFDIVYTSRGVLGWLPDLARWARVVARFLTPGGFFYLTDIHPIAKVLDDSASEVRVSRPYFPRAEPIGYKVQGTYADPDAEVSSEVKYLWPHSVAELITAVAQAGLVIEFFHEFPWLDRPWPFLRKQDERTWTLPADSEAELPLFLSLRARKPASSG
jgi:SAM-dependent methyltransferase